MKTIVQMIMVLKSKNVGSYYDVIMTFMISLENRKYIIRPMRSLKNKNVLNIFMFNMALSFRIIAGFIPKKYLLIQRHPHLATIKSLII